MALPIVQARGITAGYGESMVLREVDLAVRAGETVGLMGRNGMGKTTLIRALMGLIRPTGGDVLIDGRSALAWPTYRIARAGLAYVPEGRGILASLSVEENLAIAVRPGLDGQSPWTLERVLSLFPRVGQRLTNRGDQLSGGEQQMLAIARALLGNPRLLILDEATEGLAPLIRDEIWRTIGEIKAAGVATLVVDKTVTAVTAVTDRVVILVKGEVVLDAAPARLLADPAMMQRHLGV